MKLKYMLRGLGLGMLITAAVMGAYTRSAVADARVSVLKEYGLGEDNGLSEEMTEKHSEEVSETEPTEQSASRNEEKESEISSVLDAAKSAEQDDTVGTKTQETEEQSDVSSETSENVVTVVPTGEDDIVHVDVTKGDDSGTVSRKLFNAGLIENASEYDAFLMQHGYDKKLKTGTIQIHAGASWQEIAENLTGK